MGRAAQRRQSNGARAHHRPERAGSPGFGDECCGRRVQRDAVALERAPRECSRAVSRESNRVLIITRSPLRLALGGGGTDLPSYYQRHGGFVIGAAIDKHVYVTVHEPFVDKIILKYAKT